MQMYALMNSPTGSRSLVRVETPVSVGGFLLLRGGKKQLRFNPEGLMQIFQFQLPTIMQPELWIKTVSVYRIPVIITVQSQSRSVHLQGHREGHIITHRPERLKAEAECQMHF